MKKDVAAILAGNAGALSLYADGRWQGSTLCPEKVSADADMEKLLERCWQSRSQRKNCWHRAAGWNCSTGTRRK